MTLSVAQEPRGSLGAAAPGDVCITGKTVRNTRLQQNPVVG